MTIGMERKENDLIGEKKFTQFDIDLARMEGFSEGKQEGFILGKQTGAIEIADIVVAAVKNQFNIKEV